jgi:dihydroorotate dehydrogenase electron transfer subunit
MNPPTTFPVLTLTPTHTAMRIGSVIDNNARTRTLLLDQSMDCQPGQFIMLWLPGVGEKPFSIAGNDPLALTIVDVGPFSHAIHDLQPGERVWVRGPLGQGYAPQGKHVLLVGGGYGAAPLAFLAKTALAGQKSVDICLGARSAGEIILQDVFQNLGARVFFATDDGSLGQKGLVTAAAETAIRLNPPDGMYACGPVKMLEAVEVLGIKHHIPCQLSWEAHMRCGIGLCGHCELILSGASLDEVSASPHHRPGWLVCLDGPVSHTPAAGGPRSIPLLDG